MKLRSKLVKLTVGAALPPIVLCLTLGAVLVNYERDAFRRGAIDRNRAFMTAVDAEVRGHVLTLTALAASKRLEVDDLPAFREEAQRVVKSQPDWQSVNLTLRPVSKCSIPIVLLAVTCRWCRISRACNGRCAPICR